MTVVMFRTGRSIVRHLSDDCPHLKRARYFVRERESDLWPGFVCDLCRARATCATCRAPWPYCRCHTTTCAPAPRERPGA